MLPDGRQIKQRSSLTAEVPEVSEGGRSWTSSTFARQASLNWIIVFDQLVSYTPCSCCIWQRLALLIVVACTSIVRVYTWICAQEQPASCRPCDICSATLEFPALEAAKWLHYCFQWVISLHDGATDVRHKPLADHHTKGGRR